jgi:acyl-coenzyme A synthetase/AMP-(fatty) acid ligase
MADSSPPTRSPNRTSAAVIDDRPDGTITTLTFSELNEQANRLANVLLDSRCPSR